MTADPAPRRMRDLKWRALVWHAGATTRERRFKQALIDQAALTRGRRVLDNKQTASQAVRSFAA